VVRFLATVASAVPEARFIHHNTRFSKRSSRDTCISASRPKCLPWLARNSPGTIDELSAALELALTLAQFTHEDAHVASRLLGASGVQTRLAPINALAQTSDT